MSLVAGRWPVALLLAGAILTASTAGWAKGSESGIEFARGLETALQRAAAEDKPVAVLFQAVWCPVCTRRSPSIPGSGASSPTPAGCPAVHLVTLDAASDP